MATKKATKKTTAKPEKKKAKNIDPKYLSDKLFKKGVKEIKTDFAFWNKPKLGDTREGVLVRTFKDVRDHKRYVIRDNSSTPSKEHCLPSHAVLSRLMDEVGEGETVIVVCIYVPKKATANDTYEYRVGVVTPED